MNTFKAAYFDDTYKVNDISEPEAMFIVELSVYWWRHVWIAYDKDYFVSIKQAAYARDVEAPTTNDFDDWVQYSGHDLRSLHIMSLEEAIRFCEKGSEGYGKLLDVMDSHGFISLIEDDE